MTCFYCKGNTISSFTTHFTEVDSRIIIIKNVPCDECTQCGEKFYNGEVALQLEKIIKSLESIKTEIAIINYSDKNVA